MTPKRIWIAVILLLGWVSVVAAAQVANAPVPPVTTPADRPDSSTGTPAKKDKEPELTLLGVSPTEGLPPGLSSQQAAALLSRWAYERYRAPNPDPNVVMAHTKQAWILYRAALALDPHIELEEDLIRVANSIHDLDLSGQVQWAYHNYASNSALDMKVALSAVTYLRDRLQDPDSWVRRYATRLMKSGDMIVDRDLRERLITKLIEIAQTRNMPLAADLAIQGANIIRDKSDFLGIAKLAIAALDSDPYQLDVVPLLLKDPEVYNFYMQAQLDKILARQNRELVKRDDLQYKSAFERYEVLSFLRFRRLALQLDPMDPDAAVMFARFAENQRLYDLAAAGYEYVAALVEYRTGQSPNMDDILMKNHYKDPAGREICIQIADRIRRSGQFDLTMEGLAARAADHLGRQDQARSILSQAEKQIEQLLDKDPDSPSISPPILAWYYAFVDLNPEKALAWANKAQELFPQAIQARSLFGYALFINGDPNLALGYVQDIADQDSIAALTLARIRYSQAQSKGKDGDITPTMEALLQAIAPDSDPLAYELADKLLADLGQPSVPILNPEERKTLEKQFAPSLAPSFVPPSKRMSAKFSVSARSSGISYGRPINITLSIQNNSSDPILLRDYGLLKGGIRIDAFVRGDLIQEMPRLIDTRIQPSALIAPGKSLLIPLQIDTGPLHRLLWTHPQANLDIELVGYLDPDLSETSGVRNAFPDVPPARITIKRPGLSLTRQVLMERLDSISKGQTAQKIQSARELAGLWMEQVENARSKIQYRHTQMDPIVYLDALRHCLGSEDWVVVATTLSALNALPAPMPYEMVQAVSPSLQNPQWPVRMMALDLLNRSGPGRFQKVLDWVAASDTYPLVRDLAVSLGGKQVSSAPEGAAPEPSTANPAPAAGASEKAGK